MAPARVFIDGHAGTVGLRIHERLQHHADVDLLTLDDASRKDAGSRREATRSADVVVLCLPDDAARESAAWVDGTATRVLDASTAHRVDSGFVYGLPELEPGQRARIRSAARVTNPGCYPTGVILTARPLIEAGVVAPTAPLVVRALSGFTGGGNSLIERWQDPTRDLLSLSHDAPYALERVHKHLPEMVEYSKLEEPPHFLPAVGPFACGMRVEIPLPRGVLAPGCDAKRVWDLLEARYRDEPLVAVRPFAPEFVTDERTFDPETHAGTDAIELVVAGHPSGHVLVVALYDNLGKGACGAAIQNLNLMLGLSERSGLVLARVS